MSFYDISGKIELVTSSNPKEIADLLVSSFQSMKIKATRENNVISFVIPFLKSATRGYVFQGITSGVVDVEQTNINQLTLEYKLVTLPMRVFIIVIVPWVILGMPFLSHYLTDGSNFQGYPTFAFIALAMVSVAILANRFFIKHQFSSFLKKRLYGKYSGIKQPAWKDQIDVKRVVTISCLGVLLLTISIPAVFLFGIWSIRAKVVWQYPMQSSVMSPPLIAGNAIYFGSLGDAEQAAFYVLEKETGKEIWMEPLDGGLSSSPILADDMVCFGTDDGIFRCLDQENGLARWEFSPAQRNLDTNECGNCALKLNSPMFNGNTIYIGGHDHNLYALDSQNGQLLWSFPANGTIFDAPAVKDGILYVGSQDGNIYALDAGSGREIRHYSVPNVDEAGEQAGVYATPAIESGTIYAVNGSLTAISVKTGEIKWQVMGSPTYEEQISGDPILFKDSIIVSTIGNIYAVNKVSGDIKWNYSRIKGGVFFTPTLYEEVLYFGDSDGYLYSVNANTGRQLFRYNMHYLDFESYSNFFQEFTFPPATDEKMIYVKWFNHFYGIQGKN